MDICIKKGTLEYLKDCEEALIASEYSKACPHKEPMVAENGL